MPLNLGELLLRHNLITKDQLDKAVQLQKTNNSKLDYNLINMGFVSDEEVATCLSKQFGIPSVNPSQLEIDNAVLDMVPVEICRKYAVIPVDRTGAVITVAMSDPTDLLIMHLINLLSAYQVEPAVTSEYAIRQAIDKYYGEMPTDKIPFDSAQNALEAGASEYEKSNRMVCPYCKSKIVFISEIISCSECRAYYHAECWSASGRCSVFGCTGKKAITMQEDVSRLVAEQISHTRNQFFKLLNRYLPNKDQRDAFLVLAPLHLFAWTRVSENESLMIRDESAQEIYSNVACLLAVQYLKFAQIDDWMSVAYSNMIYVIKHRERQLLIVWKNNQDIDSDPVWYVAKELLFMLTRDRNGANLKMVDALKGILADSTIALSDIARKFQSQQGIGAQKKITISPISSNADQHNEDANAALSESGDDDDWTHCYLCNTRVRVGHNCYMPSTDPYTKLSDDFWKLTPETKRQLFTPHFLSRCVDKVAQDMTEAVLANVPGAAAVFEERFGKKHLRGELGAMIIEGYIATLLSFGGTPTRNPVLAFPAELQNQLADQVQHRWGRTEAAAVSELLQTFFTELVYHPPQYGRVPRYQ